VGDFIIYPFTRRVQMVKKVDTTAIKFNQASIIAFTLLAYVLDLPWLVLFVGAVLAVGSIWPGAALFQQAYRQVLKPMGLVKPHVIDDDPAPHRFAQGAGATFLGLSSLALLGLGTGRPSGCPGRHQPVLQFLRWLLCVLPTEAPGTDPAL
jgi:hypothetical protein